MVSFVQWIYVLIVGVGRLGSRAFVCYLRDSATHRSGAFKG